MNTTAAAAVVDTELSPSMLARLGKIQSMYKEKGDENDNTRLCILWKGALPEDKIELERLITDIDLGAGLTPTKLKQEYTKYRIYSTGCLQNAVGNYKKKAKEAIKKRDEMSVNGGGGEGLRPMNSAGRSSRSVKSQRSTQQKSVRGKKVSSGSSGIFQSNATMYKCDATARTTKTTASKGGLSFCGKSLAADGKAKTQVTQVALPVMITAIDKAIGGALAFCQSDLWEDNGLNARCSVDLCVSNGVVLNEGSLECRTSSSNPRVLVVTLALSETFTNPDLKLEYLLDRIGEAYDCIEDRGACLMILRMHPRYIATLKNLKALLGRGENGRSYLVEHRILAPFNINDSLVTKGEDPIFYGYVQEADEVTGETHIYFELKEKGKEFVNVTVNGFAKKFAPGAYTNTPNKKSMFSSDNGSGEDGGLNSIPENISFASPSGRRRGGNHNDDETTIATQQSHRHQAPAGFKTTGEEEDDEDESWDDDIMEEDSDGNSEVEKLRKELAELKSLVSGAFQKNQSQDSADTRTSTAASTPKKSKSNDGGAASVAGSHASRRSKNSRGTTARETNRKTPVTINTAPAVSPANASASATKKVD